MTYFSSPINRQNTFKQGNRNTQYLRSDRTGSKLWISEKSIFFYYLFRKYYKQGVYCILNTIYGILNILKEKSKYLNIHGVVTRGRSLLWLKKKKISTYLKSTINSILLKGKIEILNIYRVIAHSRKHSLR